MASARAQESDDGLTTSSSGEAKAQNLDEDEPYVVNRRGEKEPVNFGKINDRIQTLLTPAYGPRLRKANHVIISQQVISRFKSGMSTREIDDLVVDVCRALSGRHPDYASLAARVMISNMQKENTRTFVEVYEHLRRTSKKSRISEGFLALIRPLADEIEQRLDLRRDYINAGFSAATIVRSYLLRDDNGEIVELPQHMYMRVALAIQCMRPSRPPKYEFEFDGEGDITRRTLLEAGEPRGGMPLSPDILKYRIEEAFDVYDRMSQKRISHASPTIFNAGTVLPQYSSCFQTQVDDDLKDLYQKLLDTAMMSKTAGGVSISLDRVRAAGALISSSGGESSGIGPYVELANKSQRYANQGGNRPGAFAMYMSPHHEEIFTFLEMGLIKGARFERREDARFLKYALWVPDRFMVALMQELDVRGREERGETVSEEELLRAGDWHLFSPDEAPELEGVFDERSINHPDGPGGSYSTLYDYYVSQGRYTRVVKASEIMKHVTQALGMTGNPYFLFKDHINRQSNLATPSKVTISPEGALSKLELGTTVVCSNLCAEVTIPCYSRQSLPEKTLSSVCNLAAINLNAFVRPDMASPNKCRIDWVAIIDAAAMLANNLDKIIDLNHSPTKGCERSNQHFRAIGIGIMGLANVLLQFGYAYGSEEALKLDAAMHACIYYGAMNQSHLLAKQFGSFPAYPTSAAAKGLLQPDLCVREGILAPDWTDTIEETTGGVLNRAMFDDLRIKVAECLRNGYVTATMPTATSSNGIGVNETGEPFTTHKYMRKTLAGEFTLLNPHLVQLLEKRGLWSENISSLLDASGGSVQDWDGTNGTPRLSEEERSLFLTAREMDQINIVAHAAARNPFNSQSQSMNMWWTHISMQNSMEMWIASWLSGIKTASYYSHSSPAGGTQQMSVKAARPAEVADPQSDSLKVGQKGSFHCSITQGAADGQCTACSV